jgi:hypothetical protein
MEADFGTFFRPLNSTAGAVAELREKRCDSQEAQ